MGSADEIVDLSIRLLLLCLSNPLDGFGALLARFRLRL
jgi:hypothetical protein